MLSPRTSFRLLALILAIHLTLTAAYALLTPLWQAPDEPAHFNNIAAIVQTGHLPQLRPGDYDQAYLEQLKAQGFPPELPIAPVRYEGHQPPLYYLLMVPVWLVASKGAGIAAQVWALRLVNALIGAMGVLVIFLSARRLFPKRAPVALLAAGFAAFLPMHIAMNASINNDALAELFVSAVMLRLLGHAAEEKSRSGAWAITGALVGLSLLTKFQTYFLAPLALGVWGWQASRGGRIARAWRSAAALILPMTLLPLPWWLRNMRLYGLADPLGLNRHAVVVVGQPRTADWIATQGWGPFLDRFITFTFRSFWGVFGWMGVFMDARIYGLLTILSILILTGLVYQLVRWRRQELLLSPAQKRGTWLLLAQLTAVIAAFLWYNLDFVQHQGRYLFPALLPISLAAAAGLLGAFSPRGSRWAAAVMLILLGAGLGLDMMQGDVNVWRTLMTAAAASALFGRSLLTRPNAFWWCLAVEGGMALVAVYGLVGAILPQIGG